LRRTRLGKSNDCRACSHRFEKLRFQNVVCPHENEKPAFSNFSGLKSVVLKVPFSLRPTRRNTAAFSNFSGVVWMEPYRFSEILLSESDHRLTRFESGWCHRCVGRLSSHAPSLIDLLRLQFFNIVYLFD